ncbi:MAG: hypothetical protein A2W91_14635 [Bacteroidetes bacterium GWF2_38_335]|nr:MAG: hypothetical protein A2W91_14635 [Bacteroidetes bacterium GWF2_38_335]OFY78439.1 MAG: hypothetical protein A2281_15945 [Bacteroidetes bacterium RIFOXYA12_FULL_38_20]HBS88384.1 hypothetical protein [Bacteroidales bacterium]
MLIFNSGRIFKFRSINKKYAFLKKHGFTHFKASHLLQTSCKGITFKDLFTLCLVLRCTPNDLFDLGNVEIPAGHPLLALRKEEPDMDINTEIQNLSLEKLKKITLAIKEIKNNE